MVIAGGLPGHRDHRHRLHHASTEPAMVIAGGDVKAKKAEIDAIELQRSRRW